MEASLLLILSACVFLAIGVPVAFALGIATATTLILEEKLSADGAAQGDLLRHRQLPPDGRPVLHPRRRTDERRVADGGAAALRPQFVGHKRGGLGYTNVVSLTFFSGISGSALADAAGPGSMLIRMMDKAGYDRSYAAALTASTAIVGPIIPPSIIMIIYALQDENVSVGALFVAGIMPGPADRRRRCAWSIPRLASSATIAATACAVAERDPDDDVEGAARDPAAGA